MLNIKWNGNKKLYLVNYNGFKRWFNQSDFDNLRTYDNLLKEMGAGLC